MMIVITVYNREFVFKGNIELISDNQFVYVTTNNGYPETVEFLIEDIISIIGK